MLSEASIELPGGPDRPICTVGRDRRTRLGTPVGLASLRRHLFRRVSTSHSKLTVTCRYPRRRVSIILSNPPCRPVRPLKKLVERSFRGFPEQHARPPKVHLFLFGLFSKRKRTIRAQGGA